MRIKQGMLLQGMESVVLAFRRSSNTDRCYSKSFKGHAVFLCDYTLPSFDLIGKVGEFYILIFIH